MAPYKEFHFRIPKELIALVVHPFCLQRSIAEGSVSALETCRLKPVLLLDIPVSYLPICQEILL
jgi:hypothetical protein